MRLTWFIEKDNTLYINTDAIMCDTKGMSPKERSSALSSYFKLSYEERIEKSPYKNEIKKELAKHPGCDISEFTDL